LIFILLLFYKPNSLTQIQENQMFLLDLEVQIHKESTNLKLHSQFELILKLL